MYVCVGARARALDRVRARVREPGSVWVRTHIRPRRVGLGAGKAAPRPVAARQEFGSRAGTSGASSPRPRQLPLTDDLPQLVVVLSVGPAQHGRRRAHGRHFAGQRRVAEARAPVALRRRTRRGRGARAAVRRA
jgi:hypothetical protein